MLFLVLCVYNFFRDLKKIKRQGEQIQSVALKDLSSESKIEPLNYINILKNSKLTFDGIKENESGSPIAEYSFDKQYHVYICKLRAKNSAPLKSFIVETNKSSSVSYGSVYDLLNRFDDYKIYYKMGVQDTVSKIYLNIFGGVLKTIAKNDTLVYYSSRFKNFYIKYNFNGSQSFYGYTSNSVTIAMETMVLRSSGNIYLIFMTPVKSNIEIAPGTLLTLIKNGKK